MSVERLIDPDTGRVVIEIDACTRSTIFDMEAREVVKVYEDGALIKVCSEETPVDGALKILRAFGRDRHGTLPDIQIGIEEVIHHPDSALVEVIRKFGLRAIRQALDLKGDLL